jgi:autotransporter-associated beta strand protein
MTQDVRLPQASSLFPAARRLPPGFRALAIGLCLGLTAPFATAQDGFLLETGNNTGTPHNYNLSTNWEGGVINGLWGSTLNITGGTQHVNVTQDGTVAASGLTFLEQGSGVQLSGGGGNRTLLLGGDILHNTAGNVTISLGNTTANRNLNIDLGGVNRTVTVQGSGKNLNFVNVVSNGGLTVNGTGNVYISGASTYSGATIVNSGVLRISGNSGGIVNSAVTVNGTANVTFDNSTNGVAGRTRSGSVTLNGIGGSTSQSAIVRTGGNSTANSIDTVNGSITLNQGFGIIGFLPNAARNTRMVADELIRQAGAAGMVRGPGLGQSTIASQAVNSSNLVLNTAPTLVGGGGEVNTSTVGIIVGLIGETNVTGNGFGSSNGAVTGGLLTYEDTRGVRLLASNEYKTSIGDGQTALDNILLTNVTSGTAAPAITLTSETRVNSLSLQVTGTGTNGGITLAGSAGAKLIVDSGMIYAAQLANTQSSTNSITLSIPLDFGAREGIISAGVYGTTDSRGGALVDFSGVISNDTSAAKGLTVNVGGAGAVRFSGAASNTYAGLTTLNTGILVLQKTGGAMAVTGNLVINGGLLESGHNQIADSANITVNGGRLQFQIGNGGNSSQETFTNLVLNGGGIRTGAAGKDGRVNVTGTGTLNGGDISIIQDVQFTFAQKATFAGSAVTVETAFEANRYDTILAVNGLAEFVNTASEAYTAVTLKAGTGSIYGARMELGGGVKFVGNTTNDNTVSILANAGVNQGVVAMNGTQTFEIGEGKAAADFTVNAPLVDGSSPAGLTKTGEGTLRLLGANTYTGITTVSAGVLQVDGAISGSSAVIVGGGARITGSGTINATLGGAGQVGPGNSPGLMTAVGVDGSAGLDFAFEFSARNLPDLTWAGVENDVLRLTGASPLAGALTGANELTLYLDGATYAGLTDGDFLLGGFYLDAGGQLANLSGASIVAYYLDVNGSHFYGGQSYSLLTAGTFSLTEEANSEFAAGGSVTRFTFAAVPETSVHFLLGLGGICFWGLRRRRSD